MPQPNDPNYDPSQPVYAEPDDEFKGVETQDRNINDYVDPATATVEGRVGGLLAKGNPLLDLAESDNARNYQGRGLLNTGNAVAGGTLAVMREAREITTPDAQLYGDMSKMALQADQDADMNNQVAGLEWNKEKLRGSISGALTQQEQAGKVQIQKIQDKAQLDRVIIDNQWKRRINFDNLKAKDRLSLTSFSQTLSAELNGSIERILRDTNIANKKAAIEAMMTSYKSQMSTAAAILKLTLKW